MINPKDNIVQPLLNSPLTLTADWQPIGSLINTMDVVSVALWMDIDINDSMGVQIRFAGKHTRDSSKEYILPILTTANDNIYIMEQIYEFAVNVDASIVLSVDMIDLIPFGTFQARVETVGVAAARLLEAGVSSNTLARGV